MRTGVLSSLLLGGAMTVAATPAQRPSNRLSVHDVPTVHCSALRPVTAVTEPAEHAHIARLRRHAAERRDRSSSPGPVEEEAAAVGRIDGRSESRVLAKRLQQMEQQPGQQDPRLVTNYRDIYYIMDIVVGGQTIPVSVDTGSSDTWFVQSPLECVDFFYYPQAEVKCGFGKGFQGNFSGGMVPNDRFTRVYGDGTFVAGLYGFEDVKVGGIAVTHQQLALVNYTFWFGEGLTSGLMGLGYPLLTGLDGGGSDRPAYDPVFTSMWKRGLVAAPIFSIALSRHDVPVANASGSGALGAAAAAEATTVPGNKGSYVAFGGIPPQIEYDDASWARAPVLNMSEISSIDSPEPGMYILKADAYVWGKGHDAKLTTSAGPPPGNLSVNSTQFPVIIDVGASTTLLPAPLAKAVFASFDPPARYERTMGVWFAPCTATAPTFGITFGSQTFYLAAQDLLRQGDTNRHDSSLCRVGIIDDDYGPWVLGVTFLTNVLAVFDVGNREVRFASRIAY